MSTINNPYRSDIDGLRALSIILVLMFHAFPLAARKGFLGVDVFFVISGFLITSILVRPDLNLPQFYMRRVLRLFPTLCFSLLIVFCLGWLCLLNYEFVRLGKDILLGAGFLGNIGNYFDSGYFEPKANFKPLLHLWSLGIEEQMYLVWPFCLLGIRRIVPKYFCWIVAFFILVSVSFEYQTAHTDSRASFYFPHLRSWEFLVGALLVWIPVTQNVKLRNILSCLGLFLCVFPFIFFQETHFNLLMWTPFAVFGAALIIYGGPSAFVNTKFLSTRWLVSIGKVSYPLYLLHWPLLSFSYILYNGSPTILIFSSMIALSFLLAYGCYYFIELPFKKMAMQKATIILVSFLLAIGALGWLVHIGFIKPYSSRFPIDKIISASNDWSKHELEMQERQYRGSTYFTLGNGNNKVLLIGDSHMEQFYPRYKKVLKDSKLPSQIVMFTWGGCIPLPGVDRDGIYVRCLGLIKNGFKYAEESNVKSVVIAGNWRGGYFRPYSGRKFIDETGKSFTIEFGSQGYWMALEELKQRLKRLRMLRKKVYLVLNIPCAPGFDPQIQLNRSLLRGPVLNLPAPIRRAKYEQQNPQFGQLRKIGKDAGITVLDPLDYLCEESTGLCHGIYEENTPRFMDACHLNASFVRDHASFLDQTIEVGE